MITIAGGILLALFVLILLFALGRMIHLASRVFGPVAVGLAIAVVTLVWIAGSHG
jgi:hypothetical protein